MLASGIGWCAAWDSNPENLGFEPSARASSASGAPLVRVGGFEPPLTEGLSLPLCRLATRAETGGQRRILTCNLAGRTCFTDKRRKAYRPAAHGGGRRDSNSHVLAVRQFSKLLSYRCSSSPCLIVKELVEGRSRLELDKICFAGRRLDRFGIRPLVPGPRFELGIS